MKWFPPPMQTLQAKLFSLLLVLTSLLASNAFAEPLPTATNTPTLKHNQLGYHPNAEKLLWVDGVTPTPLEPTKFVIRNPQKKNALFAPEGMKVGHTYGELLNPSLILLDASTIKKEGVFDVFPYGGYWKPLPNTPKFSLRVNNGLFFNQIAPSTRTFFYNRAGQFLGDATSGLLLEAGHTQPQSLQGGWYEGANYHQHIVSTAWASTQLLNTYLVLGEREGWGVKLAYPSSEPKTTELPDLLHEAQIGLRWILKLQQADGSFLSGAYSQNDVAPTLKPASDKSLRLALPTSPFATAIGIATLARAAQAYKETDPSFAVSCLLAAKKGMEHLPTQLKKASVPTVRFSEPLAGTSNEATATLHEAYWSQAPNSLLPALYWAYSALAEATGDETLKQTALGLVPKLQLSVASWENPVPLVVSY
ncbi:MAG: glycoside hydrolase family 9 protein, partial [Candidatus Melainabacteria bacterium]|nr:glycoside hydrolase family 9 protein [Candidatus Melainabacteria bacterium]